MATQIRTLQAETVDALCWRHYGRTRGAVEAVLQANPGLASAPGQVSLDIVYEVLDALHL